MGFADRWLIRPGTLFLFGLIAFLGLALFTWSTQNLDAAGNRTIESQQEAIECSELSIKLEDAVKDGNYTAYISVSREVENLSVKFTGSENITRTVVNPPVSGVVKVEADMERVDSLSAYVSGCSRVFRLS